MNMSYFVKKPCKHCPFRNDVKPFLTPERGEELAYAAQNPYNSFPCHKTTVVDEDEEDEMMVTEDSKECAGFMTLQAVETGCEVEGFTPSFDIVYEDADAMADAYADA